MRAAFLSALLFASILHASAQESTIGYKDIEGIWVRAFEGFDAQIAGMSDCDLIKDEQTLTIDGRSIHGKGFDCAIKTVKVYYQTKVFAYANCSINGDSVLRRYAFSMHDNLLYAELTDFSPGEPREELASSEIVYRRAKCSGPG
jgi:hypothetical protein